MLLLHNFQQQQQQQSNERKVSVNFFQIVAKWLQIKVKDAKKKKSGDEVYMLLLAKLLDGMKQTEWFEAEEEREREKEKSRCSINMNEKCADFVSSTYLGQSNEWTDGRADGTRVGILSTTGKKSVKKQQSPWTKLVKVNNCLSTAN